jgi:GNAT superfamily N-acetyltransferase
MIDLTEAASQGPYTCQLQKIELDKQDQYQRLQVQRKQCGWYYEDVYLNRWRDAASKGAKCLFWIMALPSTLDQSTVFAGHISLDSISEYEDPKHELARPDKSLLTISTFFVLPEFQGKGLGGQAIAEVERLARLEPYGHPRCSALTMMSLSCRYVEDSELRARYIEWTGETPLSYERWYARIGYVKWKEEACTEIATPSSEVVLLREAFMKKTLDNNNIVVGDMA